MMCSCVKSKSSSSYSQPGSQSAQGMRRGQGRMRKPNGELCPWRKGLGPQASCWSHGVGSHLHASWQCSWIWARASSSMCHVGSRMLR